jgi:hypothetical protein
MRIMGVTMALALACAPVVLADPYPGCGTDPNIVCQDDAISLVFDDGTATMATTPAVGTQFNVWSTIDVKTEKVSGISYGVQHDPALLDLIPDTENCDLTDQTSTPPMADECNPTILGCDKGPSRAATRGFVILTRDAENRGFILAMVLLQYKPNASDVQFFPVGTNGYKVLKMKYKVKAEITADTPVKYSEILHASGSPAVDINLPTDNESRKPKTVNNAVIKGPTIQACTEKDYAFYLGDTATATAFAIPAADVSNTQIVKVQMRNKLNALGFSLGIKKDGANVTIAEGLGFRPVDLVITKPDYSEASGTAIIGNSATGAVAANVISLVEIGAALTPFHSSAFEGIDVDPAGAWATVGYVADAKGTGKNVIPATVDTGATCGANEILKVTIKGQVEKPKFSRGDANGDSKVNVTDGVLLAQYVILGAPLLFDCKKMFDANDDGKLDTSDPIFLLTYLFLHGGVPAAPFKTCAVDGTDDTLTCATPNCQ